MVRLAVPPKTPPMTNSGQTALVSGGTGGTRRGVARRPAGPGQPARIGSRAGAPPSPRHDPTGWPALPAGVAAAGGTGAGSS